ncbi:hypothetical protein GGR51DRAFT_496756 [Nemania sp. FL0031]|nr:hypothetical protein GGR51DRAFT_496756 [Nemania sp. FL0031]
MMSTRPDITEDQICNAAIELCKTSKEFAAENRSRTVDEHEKWESYTSRRISAAFKVLDINEQLYPELCRVVKKCATVPLHKLQNTVPAIDKNGSYIIPTARSKPVFVRCALRAAIRSDLAAVAGGE